ncbi:hypothetical protein, partial [Burkholderia contaminans]|uniref:hypothetical protein n=1 Tax=Burkholderia contaminans TaxID=488447 RepID=UPI001C725685
MASPFARAGAVARARISCCAGGWCRRIGAGSGVSSNPLRSGAVACARRARLVVTWYNQPGDTAHPYSAALVTVRDG